MPRCLVLACATAALLAASGARADADVITVGIGQTYATLAEAIAAAAPNDVIDVYGGNYVNQTAVINKPLTIQGVDGTPVFSATTNIGNGKGIFIVDASATINNIEFLGAQVADENGAGIRYEAGNLVVQNSKFINDQDGILATPGVHGTGTLLVSGSLFQGDGDAGGPQSGFTHAIYATELASLTVEDSNFQGTNVGHDIKSRAANTVVTDNNLDDGVTGTTSYAIDISNGGVATITGNRITQGVNTQNPSMIAYAAEGLIYSDNSLDVDGNIFSNSLPGGIGLDNHAAGVVADVSCNVFDNLPTPTVGPANLSDNVVNGRLPSCAAAPEPASLALLLPGLAMLLLIGKPRD
jgi:hypothetical protein